MRETVIFLVLFVNCVGIGGCASRHPIGALERQARRFDRQISEAEPEAFSDERYLVPLGDAVAAAVAAFEEDIPVVEVGPSVVGTDWVFDGRVELDQQGEYYTQRRHRRVANLVTTGAEVEIHGVAVRGQRVLRPSSTESVWSEEREELSLKGVRNNLAELERHHIQDIHADATAAVLDVFVRAVPSGFQVVEETANSVVCERITTKEKTRERKGERGVWDAREKLVMTVDGGSRLILMTAATEHRFSTEIEVGEWGSSEAANMAAAIDWLAGALRSGFPVGAVRYGKQQLPQVDGRSAQLSAAPAVPRLRGMDEIEKVITQRAYQTATGSFTVCLDQIVVNPVDASGQVWDVPAIDAAMAAVQDAASIASEAAGAINAAADSEPLVGMLVDGGVEYLSGGVIDRKQAEQIARTTAKVSGWTRSILPTAPDIVGVFSVGGSSYNLKSSEDTLHSTQGLCHTGLFRRGSPGFGLDIVDRDLEYHDPIGRCSFGLNHVIDRGVSGIGCGYARAYMRAQFHFDFDQIKIVGLPPSEP